MACNELSGQVFAVELVVQVPMAQLGISRLKGCAHILRLDVAIDEGAVGPAAVGEKGRLLFRRRY